MKLRPYQKELVDQIYKSLLQKQISVLTLCPGGGKTRCSAALINRLFKENKTRKVLVLTHGSVLLREQYVKAAQDLLPKLSVNELTSGKEFDEVYNQSQVVVAIPQSLTILKRAKIDFDMVVVDEAHQYYLAESDQKLIQKIKPRYQLLLTGTPSRLILENDKLKEQKKEPKYKLHTKGMMDILDYMAGLRVEVCSSNYELSEESYNSDEEVVQKKIVEEFEDEGKTNGTLDKMLESLCRRLNNIRSGKVSGDNKEFKRYTPKGLYKRKFKAMVACKSIKQAGLIEAYLKAKKYSIISSNQKTDGDNKAIFEFTRPDSTYQFLIVVHRGVLGFDDPTMDVVIDMSGTRNLDRMYQLMSRVVRKHPEGWDKLFIKIAPKLELDYTTILTNAMLCLTHEGLISKYNGKNVNDVKVLIKKRSKKKKGGSKGKKKPPVGPKPPPPQPVPFPDHLDVLSHLKSITCNLDDPLCTARLVTLKDVKEGFGKWKGRTEWTLELCKESAKRFKTRGEWYKGDGSSYSAAQKRGWLDECCGHMDIVRKTHTLESCKESAKRFNTRNEWRKGDKNRYQTAHRRDWLEECCEHMDIARKTHTLESCKESAKRFKTRGEWHKGDSASYQVARKRGWSDECCKHMETLKRRHLTLESLRESAKRFKTRGEWCKGDGGSYRTAQKRGWLDECCGHMEAVFRTHTLESCKESAKRFKTRTEWNKRDRSSYRVARKRGWLDECCKHMKKK